MQGATEGVHRFRRRRNGTALFQLHVPFGTDACALRHFLALQAGSTAALPRGAICVVSQQTGAAGTQQRSKTAMAFHAEPPKVVLQKTSMMPVLLDGSERRYLKTSLSRRVVMK